jgi:hypothetical protein
VLETSHATANNIDAAWFVVFKYFLILFGANLHQLGIIADDHKDEADVYDENGDVAIAECAFLI